MLSMGVVRACTVRNAVVAAITVLVAHQLLVTMIDSAKFRKNNRALALQKMLFSIQQHILLNTTAPPLWIQENYTQFDADASTVLKNTSMTDLDSSATSSQEDMSLTVSEIDHRYLARGPNFWFSLDSGCSVASWVYAATTGPKAFSDCSSQPRSKHLVGSEHLVQANDTIFVPKKLLDSFVLQSLPNLTQPFVLLSGQDGNFRQKRMHKLKARLMLNHTLVLKWFMENPIPLLKKVSSDKIAPLPFGLQKFNYNPREKPSPADMFRKAFLKHLKEPINKTRDIFYGYISPYTNPNRTKVPAGEKLPLDKYYDELAASRFVVSPAGDRMDCYRNYEALAFGAVPITELRPRHHGHLSDGPVLFETASYTNLSEVDLMGRLRAQVAVGRRSRPMVIVVNRNVVFEEYWIEYMERIVGRQLRWWDTVAQKRSVLRDFVNFSTRE